eukprot:TRINITY_DN361_c0_g1_i1.p2 TRINITY_DN361_c0_g1~~TRINITY_DN361_c0_g1_i1.p2  ORF type:complete len:106 (-),score=3.23 TRINITY_DN361_c0_g1_i1:182-499(-)
MKRVSETFMQKRCILLLVVFHKSSFFYIKLARYPSHPCTSFNEDNLPSAQATQIRAFLRVLCLIINRPVTTKKENKSKLQLIKHLSPPHFNSSIAKMLFKKPFFL